MMFTGDIDVVVLQDAALKRLQSLGIRGHRNFRELTSTWPDTASLIYCLTAGM